MSNFINHHGWLTCSLLLLIWLVSIPVMANASMKTKDAFFEGYITSILECDLEWERDSYRVNVQNGIATITLLKGGKERQAVAYDHLKKIEGLQGVNILVKVFEKEGSEQISPMRRKLYEKMSITSQRVFIPTGDVFQPLIADPKQQGSFVSFRYYETPVTDFMVASVAFGGSFAIIRRLGKRPGDGLQFGVAGALFAQFNLDRPSKDLVNADYTIGLVTTYRQGAKSLRFRGYHQSSHLGDELLLSTQIERIGLSFESFELISSYDLKNWRIYVGGEYIFHHTPEGLEPGVLHGGLEYRGPTQLLGIGRLVGGIDLKSFEEHNWSLDVSYKAGFEFGSPEPGQRRIRILAECFDGFSPHGQFYDVEITYYGLGIYFDF